MNAEVMKEAEQVLKLIEALEASVEGEEVLQSENALITEFTQTI